MKQLHMFAPAVELLTHISSHWAETNQIFRSDFVVEHIYQLDLKQIPDFKTITSSPDCRGVKKEKTND